MASTLTSNGRVTIPKKIRDALDLQPGCKLDVVMNNSGALLIKLVAPNSQKPSRNGSVKLKKMIDSSKSAARRTFTGEHKI